MSDNGYEGEIIPIGNGDGEGQGRDELSGDEYNTIMAIAMDDKAANDDVLEFQEDEGILANDEDLPEMADVIRNIWEC